MIRREALAGCPEWWSLGLSGAAWFVLLSEASPGGLGVLCLSGPGVRQGWMVVLMAVAMVPPLAVPLIRHVAARSYRERRDRAVAAFLVGAAGVWVMACGAALAGVGFAPAWVLASPWVAGAGFGLAVVWQVTPIKRRALLRCHRTFVLAPAGWGGDRDCLVGGAHYGRFCIAGCGPMMLAVLLAGHDPALGLCVQGVALAERRARRPVVRATMLALAACGVVAVVLGGG